MAQTRRKRKHRGTPAGTIERRGRTSKPAQSSAKPKSRSAGRAEARMSAAERREARFNTPPTWRSAFNRAAVAAGILVLFIGLVQQEWATALVMGVFALVIYIPMSYYTDLALYRRRMRKRQSSGG